MTRKAASETCDGCGRKAAVQELNGNEFCNDCQQIADIIKTQQPLVHKISTLVGADLKATDCDHAPSSAAPKSMPEVLDAVRFRTRDREQNTWYVSVSEMEGVPIEIFASTAFDNDRHLQSRISNLTTITRLISLILRHVFLGEVLTLEKTIKQLHRSSRQKNDLPDMLTRVLSNYAK